MSSGRKKLLFGGLTTLGFFAAVEVSLAFIGVGNQTVKSDPYIGFSNQVPLMVSSKNHSGESIITTAPNKLRLFNRQTFTAKKPAGLKRIICVGGSTTYGRPLDDRASYSEHLRGLLAVADPNVSWEVINAGGISYASYRVATVIEELSQYQPDVFIVYSAHNEFLERRTYPTMYDVPVWRQSLETGLRRTRTFTSIENAIDRWRQTDRSPIEMLPGEVDERLNHTIGPSDYVRDDAWQQDVVRHYRANLERMVAIARAADAKIIFIEPSSNEKDCSPFKNEDDFFQLAKGQFASGQFEEARVNFLKAIDHDVCPLRANSAIKASVDAVADHHNVPIVPMDQLLRRKCLQEYGHACLGNEYFVDHVHPTVDVHGHLAVWILQSLQSHEIVGGDMPEPTEIDRIARGINQKLSVVDQGIAFRNLAKVFHWSGKFDEAARHAENALRLLPDDPESQFVLADCLTQLGKPIQAIDRYEKLFQTVDYERAMLPYAYLLSDRGDVERAKAYALLATANEKPEIRESAFRLLMTLHSSLGEKELAEEAMSQIRD